MTTIPKPRDTARFGVGMPAAIHLNSWARDLYDAYGHLPYLVGTAARCKQWRDVDVRMLLPDADFDQLFPGYASLNQLDPRWSLLCASISELGRMRTGLPIDFQFQRMTDANARYDGPRHPLGVRIAARR
ncbi:hypothetical protein [Streptomyces sp. BBFR109]|uniref:hypothetical protein n=1 Tax=Streptomyces sp. BBFR109 TaxID=3448172 RepID=UPI003F759F30